MQIVERVGLAALVWGTLVLAGQAAEPHNEPLAKIKEKLASKKAVLVDVREQSEWEAGHIKGAILLPLSELSGITPAELAKKLPKDKPLYIHCVVGQRALTAANALERHGYTVRPIKPGYREMISAGFPQGKQ